MGDGGTRVERPADGRRRVVIEGVRPEVDGGRFPIKRVVGETVEVSAEIFADGHDALACRLLHFPPGCETGEEHPMAGVGGDRHLGRFRVTSIGRHRYTLVAWIDRFETWRRGTSKKARAGQDLGVEREGGARLVEEARAAAHREAEGPAGRGDRARAARDEAALAQMRDALRDATSDLEQLLDEERAAIVGRRLPRRHVTRYARELEVVVDRTRARFSAWYELFPRSTASEPNRHGTLRDVIARLPYVAGMGFDILYLPPIHPIGRTHRKGKNNAVLARPEDVGSPWAIGSEEGGHLAVHPELGTEDDLAALVIAARGHGLEIALDVAFQVSPDHPWVEDHPSWFARRADGSVQYAENPPKKYQDIYPLHFESDAWEELWESLAEVFLHWARQGVYVFRVDNPHTKPLAFWEWCITRVKAEVPEALFLSEAFTRPTLMLALAKVGFTASYQYFPWKNTSAELRAFFEWTTQPPVREYFRNSSWPNTPDILTEYLQYGGRPAFVIRLVLAATLSACYGIYGPPFELAVGLAREPGSEEYLDSEKYQIRHWELDVPGSLAPLVTRLNAIRRAHPALQWDGSLRFHATDNPGLIAYSKTSPDGEDVVLMVVSLDPHHRQTGWIGLDLEALRVDPGQPFQVHDLLGQARFLWRGPRAYVDLDPHAMPAHVLRVLRRTRSEADFEYFM